MNIRHTRPADPAAVRRLYRRVAARPGGIARLATEISAQYVDSFLARSITDGIALVAVDESGDIIAEIHACRPGPSCFSHILSDLTIVVDPRSQGCGIGRCLFEAFLHEVRTSHPDILRVELIARESNTRALLFYASLGFRQEGEFAARIRNVDGSLESDIPMAWTRPGYGGSRTSPACSAGRDQLRDIAPVLPGTA